MRQLTDVERKIADEGRLWMCPVCDEYFDAQVWHCPRCAHHWQADADTCRNCHQMKRTRQCTSRKFKY